MRFGLGLRGEPGLRVSRVATLSHADPGSLSFLANPHYRKQMESTRATAVLVTPDDAQGCPVAALIDPNPYLAYARIAELLHPQAPAARRYSSERGGVGGGTRRGVGDGGTLERDRGRCARSANGCSSGPAASCSAERASAPIRV